MECDQCPVGIAFDVVFDEVAKSQKTLPLCQEKQKKKETITLAQIKEKQLLAERRRQQKIEARLKRMQQREESSRRLVESVEILIQQKSLRRGELKDSSDVPKMSSREILKTAHDVAQRFKEMQQQLISMDLKVDANSVGQMPGKKSRKDKTAGRIKGSPNSGKDNHRIENTAEKLLIGNERRAKGIAFEVPLDEVKRTGPCKNKPPITSLSEAKNSRSGRKLTAEELNEKQRRAAERRQKRKEEKVRRTRERREALMELQTKVNIYVEHQKALKGEADPEKMLSQQDAACLAHDIADGFSYIYGRYKTDLERAEGFFMFY